MLDQPRSVGGRLLLTRSIGIDQVTAHKFGGTFGITADHTVENSPMLLPCAYGHARMPQDFHHASPQMLPMQPHGLSDQRIARKVTNKSVEVHIGLQCGFTVSGKHRVAAVLNNGSALQNCLPRQS